VERLKSAAGVDADSGVKVWALEAKTVAFLRVIDVPSCKQELLYPELISAFYHVVEVFRMAVFLMMVFASISAIAQVGCDIEKPSVTAPELGGFLKVTGVRLCRLFRLGLLLDGCLLLLGFHSLIDDSEMSSEDVLHFNQSN